MDLARNLNSAAHGHIHETIGGSWNHDFGDEVGTPSDAVFSFAHQIQVLESEAIETAVKSSGVVSKTGLKHVLDFPRRHHVGTPPCWRAIRCWLQLRTPDTGTTAVRKRSPLISNHFGLNRALSMSVAL